MILWCSQFIIRHFTAEKQFPAHPYFVQISPDRRICRILDDWQITANFPRILDFFSTSRAAYPQVFLLHAIVSAQLSFPTKLGTTLTALICMHAYDDFPCALLHPIFPFVFYPLLLLSYQEAPAIRIDLCSQNQLKKLSLLASMPSFSSLLRRSTKKQEGRDGIVNQGRSHFQSLLRRRNRRNPPSVKLFPSGNMILSSALEEWLLSHIGADMGQKDRNAQ